MSGTHCPTNELIFGNDSGLSEGSQGPAGTCVCGSPQVLVRTGRVWTAVLSGVSPGSGTCSQITAGGLDQHVGTLLVLGWVVRIGAQQLLWPVPGGSPGLMSVFLTDAFLLLRKEGWGRPQNEHPPAHPVSATPETRHAAGI